eukprot:14846561-Heterocapsa_arctica.AAC.1
MLARRAGRLQAELFLELRDHVRDDALDLLEGVGAAARAGADGGGHALGELRDDRLALLAGQVADEADDLEVRQARAGG